MRRRCTALRRGPLPSPASAGRHALACHHALTTAVPPNITSHQSIDKNSGRGRLAGHARRHRPHARVQVGAGALRACVLCRRPVARPTLIPNACGPPRFRPAAPLWSSTARSRTAPCRFRAPAPMCSRRCPSRPWSRRPSRLVGWLVPAALFLAVLWADAAFLFGCPCRPFDAAMCVFFFVSLTSPFALIAEDVCPNSRALFVSPPA